MLAVLDTNVLVSGVLSPNGPPGWIVDLVVAQEIALVVDPRIMREYGDVLRRPELKLPEQAVATLLDAVHATAVDVAPLPLLFALPDPDDEPFLASAAAAGAPLVTGNLKHYPKTMRAGVTVLTPRQFIDRLRAEKPP